MLKGLVLGKSIEGIHRFGDGRLRLYRELGHCGLAAARVSGAGHSARASSGAGDSSDAGWAGGCGKSAEIFAADLLEDAGWEAAADGADYILHVASPLPMSKYRNDDIVRSAREGTARVLKAGIKAGVRRVVVTSSIAAAEPPHGKTGRAGAEVDETVWTDLARSDTNALDRYARSKTLAEQDAWEFARQAGGAMSLASVLPSAVLGPVMTLDISGALEIVSRMLAGKVPLLPRIGVSVVDVRDLVELHILAMTRPEADGQRFLGAGEFLWVSEIAAILREEFGKRAGRVPKGMVPDSLVRMAALFDEDARLIVPILGERIEYDASKTERLLGWRTRPARETIVDCAESLLGMGILGGR